MNNKRYRIQMYVDLLWLLYFMQFILNISLFVQGNS